MKLLLKYISIILCTAVLFVSGLYFADRLVTPVGEAEYFYDEPKNSIDVLTLGGSQTMCAISSVGIYDRTGLTAYNFSTWSQPVWISYYYLQEALKTQSPKLVVLDVFGAFYDRTYMTGVDVDLVSDDYAQLIRPSVNLLKLNLARRRVQVTRKHWYEYINIAKYHTRITELTKEDLTKIFADNSTTAKGYGPFYTTEDWSDYTIPQTDSSIQLYPYAEEYLIKIIQLCRENDIKLLFVKMPHIADENDISVLNYVHELSETYGVDFLDFCSENSLNIDYSREFADHGHINYLGAEKSTRAICEYINSLGLSAEHSNQIADRWEKASEKENDDFSKMKVRLAKSFDEYCELAESQKNTAVIISKQDTNGLTDDDYMSIFKLFYGTVFEMKPEDIKDNSAFVYDGKTLYIGDSAYSWCENKGISLSRAGISEIMYNDENYSFSREGLNLAAYDYASEEIYHYISYAKEHDWQPYTR